MTLKRMAAVTALVALAGCSSSSGLSTSSIFGSSNSQPTTQTVPQASNPTSRAFQVGTVAARATKCGYNFDPVKLRTSFLAAEVARGASPQDTPQIEKVYDTSYNGVMKAVAEQADYCSDSRTRDIKTDLARHLAGDFEPKQVKQIAQQDGIFGGLFDSSSSGDSGPKFGSNDWWDKQNEKAGR